MILENPCQHLNHRTCSEIVKGIHGYTVFDENAFIKVDT